MSTSAAPGLPAQSASAPTPIRFGMIGAGFIARWFVEAAREIPDAEIIAVTSAHPERAAAFAAEHAIPAAFASLEEMLAARDADGDPLVDVVYVGSPNLLHPEHTLAALEAGRHVLVEKPFAPTPAQARAWWRPPGATIGCSWRGGCLPSSPASRCCATTCPGWDRSGVRCW
ncbi:Gfo/Idh/MocA family oxidoreductase [Actinomyces ruminis]|uniref:Gfo/Idh/MocA family protein n=1 Tax=Actinomyces ruminis TaxID=1937003 RepID=UPI0030B8458F